MAKLGDLFSIEIDDVRACLGIVAGTWKQELYVVIFSQLFNKPMDISQLNQTEMLFAGLTLDAKFYHGDWKILGSDKELASKIPQPYFKVEDSGKTMVESRDRSLYRKASKNEKDALPYRTVVAPIRIENALKAYYGMGEWNKVYDDLLAVNSVKSID